MKNEPEDASILRAPETYERANGPVHAFFGLTYSSYFVVPRIALSSMPVQWQEQFVELMEQAREMLPDDIDPPGGYAVFARNDRGRFERDPLAEYRHAPLLPIAEPETEPKAQKRSFLWRLWNAWPNPPYPWGFP